MADSLPPGVEQRTEDQKKIDAADAAASMTFAAALMNEASGNKANGGGNNVPVLTEVQRDNTLLYAGLAVLFIGGVVAYIYLRK